MLYFLYLLVDCFFFVCVCTCICVWFCPQLHPAPFDDHTPLCRFIPSFFFFLITPLMTPSFSFFFFLFTISV